MKKLLSLCLIFAFLAAPLPAYGIFDAMRLAIRGTIDKVQAKLQQVQKYYDLGKKLEDQATQITDQAISTVGGVVDVAQNPQMLQDAVTSTVMQSAQDMLNGKTDEETEKEVRKLRRKKGAKTDTIAVAELLQEAVNELKGQSVAELYNKALILRLDIADEESPNDKVDTIEQALQANSKMYLQSARRWNRILEMQAYISDFVFMNQIVNYPQEDEDEDEE